ncbi:hypothetical protein HRbin10_00357 [bacterium HR10]|nr:hypothetical protein HRbin10_00357 [bacterium HR10]
MSGRMVQWIVCGIGLWGLVALTRDEIGAQRETVRVGERPALKQHLDQNDHEV